MLFEWFDGQNARVAMEIRFSIRAMFVSLFVAAVCCAILNLLLYGDDVFALAQQERAKADSSDDPAAKNSAGKTVPKSDQEKAAPEKANPDKVAPDKPADKNKNSTPATPAQGQPGSPNESSDSSKPAYETLSLRGHVVWLDEALKRKYGIKVDLDAQKQMVALEDTEGNLHPIVKDFRGRGFHKDPRLMAMELELHVRRYPGSPMIQVVGISRYKKGVKYDVDYWCDICAIPMYELKDCECCQGPIRLRERRVESNE